MTGMFSRTPRQSERSAAQSCLPPQGDLAAAISPVMVGHAWTKWCTRKVRFTNTDLIPYPSPAGWARRNSDGPSIFFPGSGRTGRPVRRAARIIGRGQPRFNRRETGVFDVFDGPGAPGSDSSETERNHRSNATAAGARHRCGAVGRGASAVHRAVALRAGLECRCPARAAEGGRAGIHAPVAYPRTKNFCKYLKNRQKTRICDGAPARRLARPAPGRVVAG